MPIKQIYKNILLLAGKIIFLTFVITSMAFVNKEYKKKKVEVVNIKIISDNQPMMCSVEEIEKYVNAQYDLKDKAYFEINFNQLERYLNEKNEVKNTSVYFLPDGQMYIQVKERKPIVRVIKSQQSYYIDDDWKIMETTKSYKLPVLLGDIYENLEKYKHYPVYKIVQSEDLKQISVFDDAYIVFNCILKDSTIYHFTDYVYINKNQEITLYPTIGKFKITFGSSEYFQEKINKFKLFILNGLNKNDSWNKYSEINLKYKNLVYCTKK